MIFDRFYIAPKESLRIREAVLKQDLYEMRTAIDQYTQDKSRAPQELNDLVAAGYLHAIPKDPFTQKADTWEVAQGDMLTPIEQTLPGITDVKSGSTQTSSGGTAYSDW